MSASLWVDPVLRFIENGVVHGVDVVANGEVTWCRELTTERTISSFGRRAVWSTDPVTCLACLANQPSEL